MIENLVKKYDAYNVFAIKVPRRLMIQNVRISQRVRCFVGCLNRFVLRGKKMGIIIDPFMTTFPAN